MHQVKILQRNQKERKRRKRHHLMMKNRINQEVRNLINLKNLKKSGKPVFEKSDKSKSEKSDEKPAMEEGEGEGEKAEPEETPISELIEQYQKELDSLKEETKDIMDFEFKLNDLRGAYDDRVNELKSKMNIISNKIPQIIKEAKINKKNYEELNSLRKTKLK
jgi:hypothetical protein